MSVFITRAAVIGGLLALAAPLPAQTAPPATPFYGTLTASGQTEVIQWATHFWAKADTGVAVKPGDFTFAADEAMNSPLFNPLRGARASLEGVNVITAGECDSLGNVGTMNPSVKAAYMKAMLDGEFATDSQGNPTGYTAHLTKIMAAPAGTVSYWQDGNVLHSTGLELEKVAGAGQTGQYTTTISNETQIVIAALVNSGPAIASASQGVTVAQGLITGEKDQQQRFESGVRQLLRDKRSTAPTIPLHAVFGVYGELPLVEVVFDDAFVLLDTTSGALDGPFEPGTALDGRGLLRTHEEYTDGTAVAYLTASGCGQIISVRWRPSRPCYVCGSIPIVWNPPVTLPAGPTFWCTPYGLTPGGVVGCVCTRWGTFTYGIPPTVIPARQVCVCGTGGAAGCGTGWTVGTPPGGTGGGSCVNSTGGTNCEEQYLY